MNKKVAKFEKKIGIEFMDKELLAQALTHSSYAYEHQRKSVKDNEVLEFLGDSVVGLVLADFFVSRYPDLSEGELSKVKSVAASSDSLARFGQKIKLERHILLGKGEEKSGGRKKKTILAGAFEALVGAVYLDQGYEAAQKFFLPLLKKSYSKIDSQKFVVDNYKSALQEYFQKENLAHPIYKTLTSMGPDHKKVFIVEVYAGRYPLAKAKGHSKKSAEQKAARKALLSLLGRKMKALTAETFMLKK
ncbi:MAG: ribonuclease III [Clostridiales bacterium]|nr:ribonuclease III [Clostridiales bacterium]